MSLWKQATFVAIDLETTGKYPLDAEICEVAGVKWSQGQIVGEFQSLVKPTRPMNAEVIAIHNISNEMVSDAPRIHEILPEFAKFIGDAIPLAHHAPFDMGFLSWDLERLNLPLPVKDSFCTAIISRKAIPTSPNHRLQTLINYLHLPAGSAHRALDDAKACLAVALDCFGRIGADATIDDIQKLQETQLKWTDYSLINLTEQEAMMNLLTAIKHHASVDLVYMGGSRPGSPRQLEPIGIVRNPNGDFLVAREPDDEQTKRYFLSQVKSVKILPI